MSEADSFHRKQLEKYAAGFRRTLIEEQIGPLVAARPAAKSADDEDAQSCGPTVSRRPQPA